MLTYKEILYATTKLLKKNFRSDIVVDSLKQNFEEECFYVTLEPVSTIGISRTFNKKTLLISIKYFNDKDKIFLYDKANELEKIFFRKLKVNNRYLEISNVEANFINDEVGTMLDFLVSLEFTDIDLEKDLEEKEEYDLMQELYLKS
mgnify:FL=1